MSGLLIQYSKEIARELTKIAVCLPGEPVKIGDIITFPHGRSGILGRPAPFGAFRKISSLGALDIRVKSSAFISEPAPYRFSSRKAVSVRFEADIAGSMGNAQLPGGEGRLDVDFNSEGAVFFVAIGCQKKELDNLLLIERAVNAHKESIVWDDTFLVTSVTIADKALIMQASSNTAQLSLSGDVKGLQGGSSVSISASSSIKILKEKESAFIKDWSDNVTVFMDLMRFTSKVFSKNAEFGESAIPDTYSSDISLESIDVKELLVDY